MKKISDGKVEGNFLVMTNFDVENNSWLNVGLYNDTF